MLDGCVNVKESEIRVLEAIDSQGWGLRVEFARHGQRWWHSMFVVTELGLSPILESVEGDDSQPFPPSPPLQQLVLERRTDDVQVAMSVGMAGRNHWSVCVEAFPVIGAIRLDIACRCHGGGLLGNTYTQRIPWHWSNGAACLSAEVGNRRCCLSPKPIGGGEAAAVSLHSDTIMIRPRSDGPQRTRRWCYELTLSRDGEPG
jgi:hypothetical protein